jgi:hypothetical protein
MLSSNGKFIRRLASSLWVAVCILLLINVLYHRNSPPHVFGDAEEVEGLLMLVLAFPSSLIAFLPFKGIGPGLPENDVRSILLAWLVFFAAGCIQWFFLVPLIVGWIRRKFWSVDRGGPISGKL